MNYILFLVQLIHYIHDYIGIIYFLCFPKKTKYDIYFLAYFLALLILKKIIKGECLLSYLEKIIINSNYKLGDNINIHPYKKLYNNKYIHIIERIREYTKILTIIFISLRNL